MGVLYWMFWGLSPMWLGNAIFEYMELQVKYFTPDPVDMLNGTILERTTEVVHTPYGEVRRKVSVGYGITRIKYEYEDSARIAAEQGMSLDAMRTAPERK